MKVSIVTISFNQAQFLEQAIRSVLEQDYPDIEYIVVDPGSTDGSRDIIEKYRNRIAHVIFEPDRGPADGLNKGFARATGEIFGFLNADDYLLPGALSTVVSAFAAAPDIDVFSGHALVVDAVGREINRLFSRHFSLTRYVYGAASLAQQSTFFRSDAFRKAGGFNVSNKIAWDGELWVDLALSGARFGRINAFLSAFRIHDCSITGSGKHSSKKFEQYREDIFVKVKRRNRDERDQLLRLIYKGFEYVLHPAVLKQRLFKGPIVRWRWLV